VFIPGLVSVEPSTLPAGWAATKALC